MKILLKNIFIISPGSHHHLTKKDVLIYDHTIVKINSPNSITDEADEIIDGSALHVSTGWFDLHVNFREPGHECKEDLKSGSLAALKGGFTGVLMMPSTEPPLSDRTKVEYILQRSKTLPIDIVPAGTVSAGHLGKDVSEMYDMFQAGVHVFTDDKKPIDDSGLLIRALQYSNHFGGRIFTYCQDKSIAAHGIINESVQSASLGLKGIPSVAEEVMIATHLFLAEYTGAPLHFSTITTSGSVRLIREAKSKGLKVTADVAAIYLMLSDEELSEFDTNLKLLPPLRSKSDQQALIQGLADGTIDCICSDHQPEDIENKKKEFALAADGASGIETAFAVARTVLHDKMSIPELISKFTSRPRCIAGLKVGLIEEGHEANLTVFDSEKKWIVQSSDILSKSKNNPFIGKELIGKPLIVINKGFAWTLSTLKPTTDFSSVQVK